MDNLARVCANCSHHESFHAAPGRGCHWIFTSLHPGVWAAAGCKCSYFAAKEPTPPATERLDLEAIRAWYELRKNDTGAEMPGYVCDECNRNFAEQMAHIKALLAEIERLRFLRRAHIHYLKACLLAAESE